jgi:hypothetical protein
MNRVLVGAAVFSLCAVAGISTQAASVLINGDFEDEPNFGSGISNNPGYSEFTGNQIPGWTIAPNRAATIHNTVLYPFISGNYSLNTDGEGFNGHNADLYQDFATTIGTPYELAFDWEGWQNTAPATQLQISITDLTTSAVLYNGLFSYSAALSHVVDDFLGTGNTLRLEIQETPESGVNDNQFIADNFSVTAVPEPGAGVLLIAGVTALCSVMLMRKAR